MKLPPLDALNFLKTPVWLIAPQTQEILFANTSARGLTTGIGLDSLRDGRFSAHAQRELGAYLPDLMNNELIVEIWTVEKEGTFQPLSCRLSLAQDTEEDEPLIVAEGINLAEIDLPEPALEPAPLDEPTSGAGEHPLYAQFFSNSSAPMLLIDPAEDGRIVDANLAATRFYGYSLEEILQRHTWEINVMGREVLPVMQEVAKLPGRHKPLSFMHRLSDGSTRHVQTYAGPVMLEGKRLMLGIIHDITEQKRLEQVLQQQALQDPLTGLWNRRQFWHLVQSAHTQSERYGQDYSLLLIDVDHFKSINDQYGHHKGDEVLVALARLLTARVRDSDSVCRWGGEEFVILLPQTHMEGALLMAESLRDHIAKIAHPDFPQLTVSIGVAQCLPGEDINTLFNRVDDALYLAKTSGRNRVEPALG